MKYIVFVAVTSSIIIYIGSVAVDMYWKRRVDKIYPGNWGYWKKQTWINQNATR